MLNMSSTNTTKSFVFHTLYNELIGGILHDLVSPAWMMQMSLGSLETTMAESKKISEDLLDSVHISKGNVDFMMLRMLIIRNFFAPQNSGREYADFINNMNEYLNKNDSSVVGVKKTTFQYKNLITHADDQKKNFLHLNIVSLSMYWLLLIYKNEANFEILIEKNGATHISLISPNNLFLNTQDQESINIMNKLFAQKLYKDIVQAITTTHKSRFVWFNFLVYLGAENELSLEICYTEKSIEIIL